jgi:hypothetical protein
MKTMRSPVAQLRRGRPIASADYDVRGVFLALIVSLLIGAVTWAALIVAAAEIL